MRGSTGRRNPGTPGMYRRVLGLAQLVATVVLLTTSVLGVGQPTVARAQAPPLIHAHSHNDYEQDRPLQGALERGFCSIEVDIHLVDDELLVAHDREDVVPGRTLERLYLAPLRDRVRTHQGAVYPGGPSVILLIDVKSEAEPTYRALRPVLEAYADMLTVYTPDGVTEGAVTAIISGNRARRLMQAQPVRYAAYDGRLDDLEREPIPSAQFIPLISSHLDAVTTWRGEGPIPEGDRTALEAIVATAHDQDRKIRFWGTGDKPAVWQVLAEAGVDLLGTDDLDLLAQFLRQRSNDQHDER